MSWNAESRGLYVLSSAIDLVVSILGVGIVGELGVGDFRICGRVAKGSRKVQKDFVKLGKDLYAF